MATAKRIEHTLDPLVFPDSEILILGSFPSVLSRAVSFYYGNPKNRFWPLLAKILQENDLTTIENKITFCKLHHIALYDVIESCEIRGSSDSSIKSVIPSNLFEICQGTNIRKILLNGRKAEELFYKFQSDFLTMHPDISVISLPSTSPANAAFSFERLLDIWEVAL